MGDSKLSEALNTQDSFAFLISVSSDSSYVCMWLFVMHIHVAQLCLDATVTGCVSEQFTSLEIQPVLLKLNQRLASL